jgi:UDP-N-acetylmuramate--alanine ligase
MDNKANHIHFVGIKGVGMAPLALIAKQAGVTVSGCDTGEAFITDAALEKAGITPLVGFSSDHLAEVTHVITTGAHGGFDNPEVKSAKERGIPVLTQGEAVGEYMSGAFFGRELSGISIAGTHGKTTTTAMTATVLKGCGVDPSYLIGTSDIPSLGKAGHYGSGKYFIAEADEYANEPTYDKTAKFLKHQPTIAVITNIEHDHPDVFPTEQSLIDAFALFLKRIPSSGILIAYGDDQNVRTLLKGHNGRVLTYGQTENNDYVITHVSVSGHQTFFRVTSNGADLGEFCIKVIGEHNALNALAACIVALETGLPLDKIKSALTTFSGSKRRAEYIGTLSGGAVLYDDYAHHPTEIKKTLHAFRQLYPKKHVICIFQPHTYSRTKVLFTDFARAFADADQVILLPIFASAREAYDTTITSEDLMHAIQEHHKAVLSFPHASDVVEYISNQHLGSDSVIITMGAGDVYAIKDQLAITHE